MALKSLAFKFWKPAAVAGGTVYGIYGTYEWNAAKTSLKIEGMNKEKLGNLFESIDTKRSGFVDVDELTTVLNHSGHQKFSAADVKAMLAVADKDHDGKLCKDEFIHDRRPKLTQVDEQALVDQYGVPPHDDHKHTLTPQQLHDEIKVATALKVRGEVHHEKKN